MPILIVGLSQSLLVYPAFGSPRYKCKKAACDISAIGHRTLFSSSSSWYSPENEKERGAKYAAAVEQRVELLRDPAITGYVDQIAQRVAENSDADMPITVRIIQRNDAGAFTLFGGRLYLTTGLLLKLHNEAELASLLARAIAHTAMRSVARLQARAARMQISSTPGSIPLFAIDSVPHAPSHNGIAFQTLGPLKFQRDFELEADYFGIQYVYRAGYDTNCFLSLVQSLWQPDPRRPLSQAFYPFPPLAERLKKLHQEIDDILPSRPGTIISTPQFDAFIAHLRELAQPEPTPEEEALPRLIRHKDPTASEVSAPQ